MGAPDAEICESRYKIEQLPEGFIVRGADRIPVQVNLVDGTHFKVVKADVGNRWDYLGMGGECGLIEGRQLIGKVSRSLMMDWDWKGKNVIGKTSSPPPRLIDWAIGNTKRALAKRIKAERLRLVEKCDQKVYAIQKAIFAAAGKLPLSATHEDFYKSTTPYYWDDVVKYRAAALTTFTEINHDLNWVNDDWKQCYTSVSQGVYTSLTKTLMNLPGGIPLNILSNFRRVRLTRPVHSRRELIFILGCASHFDWRHTPQHNDPDNDTHGIPEQIRHIILNATAEEITRASKILGAHLRTPLNLRKAFEVTKLSQYVMDAVGNEDGVTTHNGNLVGLTEKCIDWHRQNLWSRSCSLPPETLTVAPPILLPASKNIIFLKTVGEVLEEGERQSHCISTYAKNAVSGSCYLFHIDYSGQTASAQVSATTGRCVQAYGSHNSTNKASKWATTKLNEWGKLLPAAQNTIEDSFDMPF